MWDKNQGKYCLTGDLYPFFSHSGYKSLVNQRFPNVAKEKYKKAVTLSNRHIPPYSIKSKYI